MHAILKRPVLEYAGTGVIRFFLRFVDFDFLCLLVGCRTRDMQGVARCVWVDLFFLNQKVWPVVRQTSKANEF